MTNIVGQFFLDGRPMYTGLGQNELAYYKKLVQERVQKQSKVV